MDTINSRKIPYQAIEPLPKLTQEEIERLGADERKRHLEWVIKTMNKHPLNQRAWELLKTLKVQRKGKVRVIFPEESDPPRLHSLRLLGWGVMEAGDSVNYNGFLLKAAELEIMPPKQAQEYLLTNQDGGGDPTGIVADLHAAKTPEQGAHALMDVLRINMVADPNEELYVT